MVGAKNDNFKTFARKNQTNCDEFATLEFITLKYKKYNDVFEKLDGNFPLRKHFENDYAIVLETPKRLATSFIYNIKGKKTKTFQVYKKKSQTKLYLNYRNQN